MIWTHNLSPFIFKFGPFALRWYGMAYVIGFILAYMWLRKGIEDGRLPTLDSKKLENLMYAIILGVIVGGRLGFCVQNLRQWSQDPLFVFRVWEGGMAFFGGLVGVGLALAFVGRRYKISLWTLADIVAVPAAIGLGIGRIANFVNGELWGVPTNANWGVIFPRLDQQPRHPSQLYEMVTHFALAVILIAIGRQGWAKKAGVVASCYVIGYDFFRLFTEAFRVTDTYYGPFTNGQVASFVALLVGVWMLVSRLKAAPVVALTPAPEPEAIDPS